MGWGSVRRWSLCVVGLAGVGLATAASAWGCASVGAVDVKPGVVQAGAQAEVVVTFVNNAKPVDLRWDALDGPLLARIEPATFYEGLHGNWRFASTTITIPADAKPGDHILIANQEAVRGTATWGMPARGLVQVSAAGSPAVAGPVGPPVEVRPTTLVTEESVSGGTMLMVALGAAGVTMLLAGIGVIVASSRRSRPATATVPMSKP